MPSDKRYTYAPSPVPTSIDLRLLDWLRREFQAVARGLQTIVETTVRYAYGHMVSASAQAIADITATQGLPISVARSVTLSNVNGQAELQLAGRADVLWFEISSTDSFTGCSWQAKSLTVWSIGP
jgi:hypothetical protein